MENKAFLKLFLLLICSTAFGQEVLILPNGHAHNDYTHDRPLLDALQYGFTSVEADVYWKNERMVVTHNDKSLESKPTLQELYLDPLRVLIAKNGGTVYPGNSIQLVLMVDLKSDKMETYQALKKIFLNYTDIIEWHQKGIKIHGPVKVLLTGEPPLNLIQQDENRLFYVDGTVAQWSKSYPVSLMPRASTNYRNYFKWYGKGPMPAKEQDTLKKLIQKAHKAGRKVRFWGCPNRVEVWRKLLDEGADWINVDDLAGFSIFYKKYTDQ